MDDARDLIRQAFRQARDSGKGDWRRMTTAGLKSRILTLTNRRFEESAYGAASFAEFLSKYADIIAVDRAYYHPIVELNEEEGAALESPETGSPSGRGRIRSDLWRATLDYSSGDGYVWDPIINQARPAQATDDGLKFRTLTVGEYRQWRANFIASLQGIVDVTEGDNLRLSNWQSRLSSTPNLPNHLISRWNRYVRDQVHQHVQNWFQEQDLSPPPDLMLNVDQGMRREITSTVALRDLILNVVREMTEAELSQLILPPQAILRAVRARRL